VEELTMSDARRFIVHADHAGGAHSVEGPSFEAAALAFIDAWHPAADADGDVSVFVTDEDTGRRQCFRIDLASGDAAPCD
jgi:hypothetical protein